MFLEERILDIARKVDIGNPSDEIDKAREIIMICIKQLPKKDTPQNLKADFKIVNTTYKKCINILKEEGRDFITLDGFETAFKMLYTMHDVKIVGL